MPIEEKPKESTKVKKQLKIRLSWILLGILLFLFGLIFPFALNFYYSSSFSQETGEKPENIILESASQTKPAKTNYEQPILQFENDTKQFSPDKIIYTISASETDNLESSRTSSFSISKITAIPRQTPKQQTVINKGVAEIKKKKISVNKGITQIQKPPIIQQTVRESRSLFLSCPRGKDSTNSKCGDMEITFADAIREFPQECAKRTSSTTLDFSKCGRGTYQVKFVRNYQPVIADIAVKDCECITPNNPTNTNSTNSTNQQTNTQILPVPPTNTVTPPISPTISPSNSNNINANTKTPKSNPSPIKPNQYNNNTNINDNLTDYKDKFSYVYPSRFIRGAVYTISLSLQPINRASATIGKCLNSDERRDGADVAVRLEKTTGLEIIEPPKEKCFYDRNAPPGDFPLWKWKVKLSDTVENPAEVVLKFNYDIEQKFAGKSQLQRSNSNNNKIPHGNISVTRPVGLPFFAKIVSSFSTVVGGIAFAFGFFPVWWRKSKSDEVLCTVFAPPNVKAGSDFLVQVFAHLQEQAQSLAEIAQATDDSLKEQTVRKLIKFIERGSKLTFQLLMSNVEIDEPVQNQAWEGSIIEIPFIVTVPKDCESGLKIGKIIISENNVPIGRLTFKVTVSPNAETSPIPEKVSDENIKRYQMAFISYASENRPEVLERVQMLEAAKIKYFQDVLQLNPGDRWEKELYKHIDESDVVFLFWSTAASKSKWVEQEILYAVEKQGGNETSPPDIIPIIIEGPPPVKPPPSLNFLHFNDKFIYFIYAAEAEKKDRTELFRN